MKQRPKNTKQESRFAKKANDLSGIINQHYNTDKPKYHPYSFSANRYRIGMFIGVIMIMYALYANFKKHAIKSVNCDASLQKTESTVQSITKSISMVYDIYKGGGLKIAADFMKIKNDNKTQRYHINFNKPNQSFEQNVLICGQKIAAKIGLSYKDGSEQKNESKDVNFTIGADDSIKGDIHNIFLRLVDTDNITAVMESVDDSGRVDLNIVYISDINSSERYILDRYDYNVTLPSVTDSIGCNEKATIEYSYVDLTDGQMHFFPDNNKIMFTTGEKDSPIMIDRIVVGNGAGSEIKITTKLKNLCLFRSGVILDKCANFWKIKDIAQKLDNIAVLNIKIVPYNE